MVPYHYYFFFLTEWAPVWGCDYSYPPQWGCWRPWWDQGQHHWYVTIKCNRYILTYICYIYYKYHYNEIHLFLVLGISNFILCSLWLIKLTKPTCILIRILKNQQMNKLKTWQIYIHVSFLLHSFKHGCFMESFFSTWSSLQDVGLLLTSIEKMTTCSLWEQRKEKSTSVPKPTAASS